MLAYWAFGIVMAAGLQAQPQDCYMDVYLRTGTPIPAGMLPKASLKVTAIFREIGVNVRMRTGRPARGVGQDCGNPIVIEFDVADGYRGSATALAYAVLSKESGICIHVLMDRIVRLNRKPDFANVLLAHVMVHEITHVLEQIDRHSAEGMMKAVWSSQDYKIMKYHSLPFDPEDVDLILKGLSKRLADGAAH
jgi:hypothetical protein